jgi:hypothetical protein
MVLAVFTMTFLLIVAGVELDRASPEDRVSNSAKLYQRWQGQVKMAKKRWCFAILQAPMPVQSS